MTRFTALRTGPISPHFGHVEGNHRPGKLRRPLGEPVSSPKPHTKFIPPPSTNLDNLSLDLEMVLPEEAEAAVDTNSLVFHSVGDTGGIHGTEIEEAISDAMDKQISQAQN